MVDAVLANAKTRMFDLTRLISRAGLHPTGVDRVERAYLRELVSGRGGEALWSRAYRFGLCLVGSRRLQSSCRGG